jgi:hypothetical protein
LSALVGCETATATFVAKKLGLNIRSIDFDVHAERDQRGALTMPIDKLPDVPSRLLAVRGTATITTDAEVSAATMAVLEAQVA